MCNLFNKKVIIDIPKNHFQIIYITIHDHLALCYLIIQVCEVPALKIEYLLALDLCIGPLLCACSMQMITRNLDESVYDSYPSSSQLYERANENSTIAEVHWIGCYPYTGIECTVECFCLIYLSV
jgi:tRNA A22 N-methylase